MSDKKLTASDAGRRGGVKIRDTLGSSHFREIGRKGGEAVKAKRGPEFYKTIGRMGGKACRDAHGISFYEAIGTVGGEAFKIKMAEGGGDKCAQCSVKRVLHAQSPQACSAFVEPELAHKAAP